MKTFEELGLSPGMLEAVRGAGFEMPTPVQQKAIPVLLAGRDLVAQAQTGTGKTAAFALPLIDALDPAIPRPQALVLCPTRELAVQVASAIYTLGRWKGIRVLPIYGGQPIDRQLRSLRAGAQVLIATPGRLLDHLRRGSVEMVDIRRVVLDEADEMLAMGFIEDIEAILEKMPETRQTSLFSATMPAPIARLAGKFLKDPERLTVEMEKRDAPLIRQSYYEVPPGKKLDALVRILDMESPGPTIVFCRTRQDSGEVAEMLRSRGYMADSLSGELSQTERDRTMARFREGKVDLLVATDVASRGLDIETVTHVINLDVPWDAESYTHRIGRTGRAGREGDALTLIYPKERRQLREIEKATKVTISPLRLPTVHQIQERRLEVLEESVRQSLGSEVPGTLVRVAAKLLEGAEAPAVVGALLRMVWDEKHTGSPTLEEELDAAVPAEQGMVRLFINIGRLEGLRPGDLVGAIANEAGVPGKLVGAIDILDHIAFFEVPGDKAPEIRAALGRTKIRGRRVRLDLAREDHPGVAVRRGAPRFRRHEAPPLHRHGPPPRDKEHKFEKGPPPAGKKPFHKAGKKKRK